jgi:hypothetical protein
LLGCTGRIITWNSTMPGVIAAPDVDAVEVLANRWLPRLLMSFTHGSIYFVL